MHISIVIPVYNAEPYLQETLTSVLEQTYKNYEIIFVDDGSSDGSWDLLKQFSKKYEFVYCYQLAHGGVEKVRNHGISKAKYDWVAFLDADDKWHPQKLEKQVAFLAENPDVKMVGAYGAYFTETKKSFGILNLGPTSRERYDYLVQNKKPVWVLTPSVLCEKKALQKNNGFNTEFQGSAEDLDLWTRVAQDHITMAIPEILVYVRLSAQSASMHKYKKIVQNTDYIRFYLKEGKSLSIDAFREIQNKQNVWKRLNKERFLRSTYYFRHAGLFFLNKDMFHFSLYMAIAAMLSPAHVWEKLKNQILGKFWQKKLST